MALSLDRTIKASDVLTSLTIIVSVVALLVSWTKDRDTRTRESADRVRSAAAQTLAKLERWEDLELSLYRDLQPAYVETSETLARKFDVIAARDQLWKQINAQHIRVAGRVLDEGIETAYTQLFAYSPSVRKSFLDAIRSLKVAEQAAIEQLLLDTQGAVLSFKAKEAGYSTAHLGNALREVSLKVEEKFRQQSERALKPIRDELYALITSSDEAVLSRGSHSPRRE